VYLCHYLILRSALQVVSFECSQELTPAAVSCSELIVLDVGLFAGHVRYCMEVHVLERPIFYMGDERESRIHERMCKYVVNGERVGYGISEWCYRFVLLNTAA